METHDHITVNLTKYDWVCNWIFCEL